MPKRGTEIERLVGERIAQVRERRGWNKQELAQALKDVGSNLDRFALAKIEGHHRGISVEEVLLIAAALGVSPVQLLTPHEQGESVSLGSLTVGGERLRRWIRGRTPLTDEADLGVFFGEVSRADWHMHLLGYRAIEEAMESFSGAVATKDDTGQARALKHLIADAHILLERVEGVPPEVQAAREKVRERQRKELGLGPPPKFKHKEGR